MRKNIYILFTLFFPIVFFAQELKTTPELSKIFTESEIADINTLVDYFESKIQIEGESLEDLYKGVLYSSATYDESFFSLNIFNLEDLESTFDKIEKKTFKEIWNYSGTIYI
ncbi:MAG: hypothetical protein PSN34_14925, partial [Urechidicola sp.]|nr:hypothetical protein [Urechidicola sp.]